LRRRSGGFTLIEMLVVVIIVAILAGIVLGLLKVSGQWAAKAQTNERLGKVRAAIEEFHAEYGSYPPVQTSDYGDQPFGYEYPTTNGMNTTFASNMGTDNNPWSSGPVFTFGLMSYLVLRYTDHADNLILSLDDNYKKLFSGQQWTKYNQSSTDQSRDINAVKRWKSFLDGITEVDPSPRSAQKSGGGAYGYTNLLLTVKDGWNQELHYSSPPPYQSYKLWSDGQPGANTPISTGPGY